MPDVPVWIFESIRSTYFSLLQNDSNAANIFLEKQQATIDSLFQWQRILEVAEANEARQSRLMLEYIENRRIILSERVESIQNNPFNVFKAFVKVNKALTKSVQILKEWNEREELRREELRKKFP